MENEEHEHIWYCKIGGKIPDEVWEPGGHCTPDDPTLREPVQRAYEERFGVEAEFVFSGWGQQLSEPERAAVENRVPAVDLFAIGVARAVNDAYFGRLDELGNIVYKGDTAAELWERGDEHREALVYAVEHVLSTGLVARP